MLHFIVPLYNTSKSSIDNIERLSCFLKANLCEPYEIVLCDDGSTDDTLSLIKKLANSGQFIRVLGYKINRGRGFAVKFAGNTCQGQYLIYFDSDFPKTTNLFKLIDMLNFLRENDIVIGSRFLPDSKIKRFPLRAFVSKVYRWLIRIILPELKISDVDVGFKGFKTTCFNKINKNSVMNGWIWDLELLAIARAMGMKIKEFPIDWNERYDNYNSSVRIFRDSLEELAGIIKIRLRNFNKLRK